MATNNADIVFVWDRQGDAMYETVVLAIQNEDRTILKTETLEVVANIHVENPCKDVNDSDSTEANAARYSMASSKTSQDVMGLEPGDIRGLCVREEDASEASFAWGISPAQEALTNGTPDVDENKTVELTWTGVNLKAAFDYELSLAADPERPAGDNKIDGSEATSKEVQNACDDGRQIDTFTPDIDLDSRTVSVDSGLNPHTGYLLCVRASNGTGIGAWAVPTTGGFADEIYTRPAAPPKGGTPDIKSVDATSTDNEKLAPTWEIGTRNVSNIPRESAQFKVAVFAQNANAPDADALKVADCHEATAPDGYALVTSTPIDGLSGFEVSVAETAAIERAGFTRRVYLCAQANSGAVNGRGIGPWTLTGPYNVTKPSGLSATIGFVRTKNDSPPVGYGVVATLTIKNWWNNNWGYKSQVGDAEPSSCMDGVQTDDQGTGTAEISWSPDLGTKLTVEVFAGDSDDSCRTSLRKSTHTVPPSS